jgi:hypothetical protein
LDTGSNGPIVRATPPPRSDAVPAGKAPSSAKPPRAANASICSRKVTPRDRGTRTKVFYFFFSRKNTSSFSEEKEAKRLLFLALRSEPSKLEQRSLCGKDALLQCFARKVW